MFNTYCFTWADVEYSETRQRGCLWDDSLRKGFGLQRQRWNFLCSWCVIFLKRKVWLSIRNAIQAEHTFLKYIKFSETWRLFYIERSEGALLWNVKGFGEHEFWGFFGQCSTFSATSLLSLFFSPLFPPRVWEYCSKHWRRQNLLYFICHLWDSALWFLIGWNWRPTWNHLWQKHCKSGEGFPSEYCINLNPHYRIPWLWPNTVSKQQQDLCPNEIAGCSDCVLSFGQW